MKYNGLKVRIFKRFKRGVLFINYGRVAELAYAYGLGPYAARLGGSSPLSPTMKIQKTLQPHQKTLK